MASVQTGNMIVSLDIGTSKVVALVAEVTPEHTLEIVGVGNQASAGLKKGVVTNVELAAQVIQQAIEEAQQMAGCRIHSVFVGISGSHVAGLNSHGLSVIRDREVTALDVEQALEAARAVDLPAGQRVLHTFPRSYKVNNQVGVIDPIGMSGARLEAHVHIVTCGADAQQDIENCVQQCDLEVDDIILASLASAEAVLLDEEKQLGVCLIDIGAGTTDVAVFVNGSLHHSAVIPVGGDQFTADISYAMRLKTKPSEDIKKRYACALSAAVGADEHVQFPDPVTGELLAVPRQFIATVVEARYEELLLLVREELVRHECADVLAAGIVLTGSTARMEGALELAEDIFRLPVRLGLPQHISGLDVQDPAYATSVGLLLCGLKKQSGAVFSGSVVEEQKPALLERFKRWVRTNL